MSFETGETDIGTSLSRQRIECYISDEHEEEVLRCRLIPDVMRIRVKTYVLCGLNHAFVFRLLSGKGEKESWVDLLDGHASHHNREH
jgi:hypothetical protein